MLNPSSQRRLSWHTVLIAGLTVTLLWLFLRTLNLHEVWVAITRAHIGFLTAATLIVVQTYLFRSLRWQALLRPIGHARFKPTFRMTVIGFAANFLLPGRVGEVLRPYLLARSEGFSPAATFATVIIERVMDLLSVMLLFAWFLFFANVDVGRDLKWAGAVSALAAVAGLGLLALGAGHPERLERIAGRLTRRLPQRVAGALTRFVRTFASGLVVMRRPGTLVLAFGFTLLLWLSIALSIWFTSLAFDLTFSFSGSFLVVAALMVGVSLPTPAGMGGFQVAYVWAAGFFGVQENVAGACAIVLHAISIVPVAIAGLVFMAQDGLTLGGLQRMKSTAEAAEQPSSRPDAGNETSDATKPGRSQTGT